MKKVLLSSVFLLFAIFSAFSSVSFSCPVDENDKVLLTDYFIAAISGRKDAEIEVKEFTKSDERILIVFDIENNERRISAASYEELGEFINNALSIEPLLFLDGSTLFYVTDDIIASHDDIKKGDLVEAYDGNNRRRALLEVVDRTETAVLYSPIYQKDLVAGLELRDGPEFSLSLRALSNFSFSNFSFALDFSYLPLFAYFNPVLSFYVSYDGAISYYGGIGFDVRFPLERLFNTRFTLIEEGAVFASAMLYLGYDDGFSVASGFSVGYEHHISSRWLWRIAWETSTINHSALMLSFGVLF